MSTTHYLLMEYVRSDIEPHGVPIAILSRSLMRVGEPYLEMWPIGPVGLLSDSGHERDFFELMLHDVSLVASESAEAAMRLFTLLELAAFGPLRCFRIDGR